MVYGRQVDSISLSPGPLRASLQETQVTLERLHFTSALWSKRVEMWTGDAPTQARIAGRLGWLDALDFVAPQLERLRACAAGIQADGFTRVLLLGMGGSSLAPEVMRQVLGVRPGLPSFRMLDSVDPDAVHDALSDVGRTLFLFASKSGGTIEPNAMAAEAARRLEAAGVHPWGSRFVAITDEGTALHRRAIAERFRDVFVNPSDIGGRYSALSLFGLLPAALMGVDLEGFVGAATAMATACRREGHDNPGTSLGALIAAGALHGRDKLTLVLPPRLASFGLWVEQLVAESTGKNGVGVVPITGEDDTAPLGTDRVFVIVHVGNESPRATLLETIRSGGHPFAEIRMPDALALGAEFFRWEVATAVVGRLLGVNPFDEPNVQQAKDATRVLLDAYASSGALPRTRPDASIDGIDLTLSSAARAVTPDPTRILHTTGPGDYLSLMAFTPPEDPALAEALAGLRRAVGARSGRATMFGYGPRYLHSTGQLHKGGANNGVFIVITGPPAVDFPVPDAGYSFATLERAQALGDFTSLEQTGRRALLVDLPSRSPEILARLTALLTTAP
jgi:glucose-6-phosphate isomerase